MVPSLSGSRNYGRQTERALADASAANILNAAECLVEKNNGSINILDNQMAWEALPGWIHDRSIPFPSGEIVIFICLHHADTWLWQLPDPEFMGERQ
jgi:hypothetical protein